MDFLINKILLRLIVVSFLFCQIANDSFAQSLIDRVENSPYPRSSQSDTLYVFNDDSFTHDELLLLQCIQGLCAKIEPKIYRDKGSGSAIWIQDLEENYNIFISTELDGSIDSVLTLVPQNVSGYILCNLNDNSTNVANSLCGPLNALAVTTELQYLVEEYGFTLLLDVRDKDEQWVMDHYSEFLSDEIVTYQREDKSLFFIPHVVL